VRYHCLSMKCAFVTGAGGFIGGYVVREFAARGWRVLAGVHKSVPDTLLGLTQERAVSIVRTDVTDRRSLAALARVGPIDAIVHCAGRASDVGRRSEFRRLNYESVQNLGQLALEREVARLVFVSTTDVYGLRDFNGEAEDELPLRAFPRNPYPEFKIRAEQWLREALPAERHVIIRPAQVWGAGDTTLTPRIVGFLRKSPWIVHFGKWRGTNRWPLAHVRNVAAACCLAATDPAVAGQAINVLDDERTSMDEWYRLVADLYLPGKAFRRLVLPMAAGRLLGGIVSGISNTLNLAHPFADPSFYAVFAVSSNLDFSSERYRAMLARAGARRVSREDGLAELRKAAHGPG
jgi:nucleoside-diphosphate-sugar epimerase